jgi:DUF4097 and DUF4098 domain-containing protein YvlB
MLRTFALAGAVALALSPFELSAAQRRPVPLEAADCDSLNQMSGDFEVGRAVQSTTIPVSAGTLELRPDFNGGVRIERGAGGIYGVTACIAAGANTRAEAQAIADSVRLEVSGASVRVRESGRSPAGSWHVQLLVTAPDGASIVAETSNGPIGVRDFAGTLDLRASNGPISLHAVEGDVKARASNGPVSVAGSRGEFDVETANGPISVTFEGQRWDGHLTARASNGPLTVTVPSGFQSGVEVRSSAQSPWSCRAAACSARGGRDWDDSSRMLHIGSDPVVVKLSTVNGPVTVRDR